MRIAQLTDFHWRQALWGCQDPSRAWVGELPDLLPRALKALSAQQVDVLAVTGDLVDVPGWVTRPTPGFWHEDPGPWLAAARQDYQAIRSLLDGTGLPYVVLPGNHDHAELLAEVFADQPEVRDIAGYRLARFTDHEHEGHIPRRFIPQRLLWNELVAATDGLPQVHLQHYLMHNHHDVSYPHAYAECDFLREKLAAAPRVRLCLSGHYHAGADLTREGNCCFAVTPAFCKPPFRWRIYDLQNEGQTCQVEMHELGAGAGSRRPVVFLDRDGVINDRPSFHAGPEAMQLLPGAAQAIRRLNDAGKRVVVVTNQSAVGYGYFPAQVMQATNDRMARLLHAQAGARLDAIWYATDAGDWACLPPYRTLARAKPKPTMLHEIAACFAASLADAWMVGDNLTDVQAAAAAGVRSILVRTGHGEKMAARCQTEFPRTPIVADLAGAVDLLLAGDLTGNPRATAAQPSAG